MFVIDKKWGDAERDKLYEARGIRCALTAPRQGGRSCPRRVSASHALTPTATHLHQGLETYGVGAWKDIRSHLLPAVRVLLSLLVRLSPHAVTISPPVPVSSMLAAVG